MLMRISVREISLPENDRIKLVISDEAMTIKASAKPRMILRKPNVPKAFFNFVPP